MSQKMTIQVTDEIDRWKWVCPRGHRQWEPTNHHFWCATCARANDDEAEPEFDELRNKKTGETVHRDDLRLLEDGRPTEGSA
jgi:hypothetical protein